MWANGANRANGAYEANEAHGANRANEAYEANEAHGANRANGAYEAYGSMLHECFSPGIAFRRKSWAPQFMLLSIGFLDERQLWGAYHKSRRYERTQTGVLTPGNVATTEKAPKGRQNIQPVR